MARRLDLFLQKIVHSGRFLHEFGPRLRSVRSETHFPFGTNAVVPGPEQVEVALLDLEVVGVSPPCADSLLQCPEQPLDTSVLPRRKRRRPLVTDTEQPHRSAKQPRGKDGLVISSQNSWLAEGVHQIEDDAEDVDGSATGELVQGQASAGSVVDDSE